MTLQRSTVLVRQNPRNVDHVEHELRTVVSTCIVACLALGSVQFLGSAAVFNKLFASPFAAFDSYRLLEIKLWWVACTVLSYVILPSASMLLVIDSKFKDCNLSFAGFSHHIRMYVLLLAMVAPVVWIAARSPAFYTYYPMYSLAGRSWVDLWTWEIIYVIQFAALEFFFRGFLLGILSRHIGVFSVPICVIPYMMVHFAKPWPEVAGSVIAGLVLGSMAWKTKSIWGGVIVHGVVACSMDLLSLGHRGTELMGRHF